MVLISIHPFALRKIFLLAVALLGASSAFCFADPLFMIHQYGHSRDQAPPAQSVAAQKTNSQELSLSCFSSEGSDLRTPAVITDPGEIRPMLSETPVDFFAKTPVCWRSNARPKPAMFGSENEPGLNF